MKSNARRLTPAEKCIVGELLERSGELPDLLFDIDGALVAPMDDGGMGSLRFVRPGVTAEFGRQLAALTFLDLDGVPASVTLNVDSESRLFELDVFKSDFSALRGFPD